VGRYTSVPGGMADGFRVVHPEIMHGVCLGKFPGFLVLIEGIEHVLYQNWVGVEKNGHCWEENVDCLDVAIGTDFLEENIRFVRGTAKLGSGKCLTC
jgi:hypothetical protein